jgi:hypothetical protein
LSAAATSPALTSSRTPLLKIVLSFNASFGNFADGLIPPSDSPGFVSIQLKQLRQRLSRYLFLLGTLLLGFRKRTPAPLLFSSMNSTPATCKAFRIFSPVSLRPPRAACGRAFLSTIVHLQTDTDFARFIVAEVNTSFFKSFLYLEDCCEVTFHNPLILLDPLERRQPNPGGPGKLNLAPAE